MRHQRSVEWISDGTPRAVIDQDLYSLGVFPTVWRIGRNDVERRIQALLAAPPTAVPDGARPVDSTTVIEPKEVTDVIVDLGETGRDQIRRRLTERFKGYELARLVGELLKAEGFVCDVSPAGPDAGVDILAGQGRMGFDGATMAVQVKSGSTVVDAPTMRELKGVRGNFGAKRGCWSAGAASLRPCARRHGGSSSKSDSGILTPLSTSCRTCMTASPLTCRPRYHSSVSGRSFLMRGNGVVT